MNPDNHECKLRNKIIEDGDCYETVMAVNELHSKTVVEKLLKEYPNAKETCLSCKFNLYNADEDSEFEPCICCGSVEIPKGNKDQFFICPKCGWENDYIQREDSDFWGGANPLSLNEHRALYKSIIKENNNYIWKENPEYFRKLENKIFEELHGNSKNEYIKVYQSESDSYIEKKIIGKYKYIGGESTIDLVKDKVYFRVEPDNEFRIVDDSGEDYLYNPDSFEEVE